MKVGDYYFDPVHVVGPLGPKKNGEGESLRHAASRAGVVRFDGRNFSITPLYHHWGLTQGSGSYVAHVEVFKHRKGKSYALQRGFGEELLRSEIKKDIGHMFPDAWSGYVALPPGLVMWQNARMEKPAPIVGMYLSVGVDAFLGHGEIPAMHEKSLWYTALSDLGNGENGVLNGVIGLDRAMNNLDEMLTLDLSEGQVASSAPNALSQQQRLCAAAMLLTIYVNGGNPDLRHLKPEGQLSKSMKQGLINKGRQSEIEENYAEDILMPIELVSWNWLKPSFYEKEQWLVPARFVTYWTEKGRTKPITRWLPPTVAHRNPELLKR